MSRDVKVIEAYINKALENNHPMTREGLLEKVAMDVTNGESVDSLIEEILDRMVGEFKVIEEAHGKLIKYRLNK